MAINKVKLPNGNTENIQDSRIPGVDTTPTANSANLAATTNIAVGVNDKIKVAKYDDINLQKP